MTKKSLEARLERIEDINQIKNLMVRYEFYHTAGMEQEVMDLFALKTPGVSAEIGNWGVYAGPEGIRRLTLGVHKSAAADDGRGFMVQHTLTAPVIQVSGDGKTAKAVWISPGHETMKRKEGFHSVWAWLKYGCDFIREDGTWKIWHSHVYGLFMTPIDRSWIESVNQLEDVDITTQVPPELRSDKPCTHPLWMYSTKIAPEYVPVPPEPYETFDEKTRY
jgi:hypothetical protein